MRRRIRARQSKIALVQRHHWRRVIVQIIIGPIAPVQISHTRVIEIIGSEGSKRAANAKKRRVRRGRSGAEAVTRQIHIVPFNVQQARGPHA